MDSENSGSIQSSSGGGDEECNSRADSISATFMNHHATTHVGGPISKPPAPPFHHNPTPIFEPLSNYFDSAAMSRQPSLENPLLNLHHMLCSSQSGHNHNNIINPYFEAQSNAYFTTSLSPSFALPCTVPFPPVTTDATPRAASSSATHGGLAVRNPKKRSRASRRTPTTVLTTDTTNFRAMVQEFTGIPAPPFTSSSPFPRSRLDLFSTPFSIRSDPPSSFDNPSQSLLPPPYLLRPFPQKLQPPPFISSSSSSSPSISALLLNSSSTNNNSLLNNMQNPITSNLTFQCNFLNQSPPKYSSSSSFLGSQTHEIPSSNNRMKVGVLDEFGLSSHSGLPAMPNLCSDGNGNFNEE